MNTLKTHILISAVIATTIGMQRGEQTRTWIGENVLATRPAKDIKFWDRVGDKDVTFAFSGRWPLKVRDDKDGRLRLHDGRREGWVNKVDFVLAAESFTYFDGRIQANPKDTFALSMRGGSWMESKEFDKAIADFNVCIQINPADATNIHNRGLGWNAKKEYDKAIADFTEALRIDPKRAITLNNRALAYRNKKEYDKAIEDYNEALRLEPKYANALFGRGAAWSAKKDYDKAIKDFDDAIREDPKMSAAFNDRGLAWAAKKQYEKAIQDYDESIRLNPKGAISYNHRGYAWKNLRQYEKAIKDYEESMRLDPKYSRPMSNLAWVLATCPEDRLRGGAKAVEMATKACQLSDWKEPVYIDVLAAAYAEAGDFTKAIQYEKQALGFAAFAQDSGESARRRLSLYEQGKAFRE